ncbi:hypothetical protein [Candidatus Methylacidithermus pantelleriae]|uniref:Uncharacterized protein n=1 Tax=Candidatus Methylacidithermus pantelleriae TaxID=2744239 RepID=A0A8J2BM45_9BACT|nr:hypothetical protein [Candidatus Methylacidithermus pantelleriae]CAF0700990.1 hypothetical protein MPNT_40100 [Candidatus Methylacidithermus pantelleriae]
MSGREEIDGRWRLGPQKRGSKLHPGFPGETPARRLLAGVLGRSAGRSCLVEEWLSRVVATVAKKCELDANPIQMAFLRLEEGGAFDLSMGESFEQRDGTSQADHNA